MPIESRQDGHMKGLIPQSTPHPYAHPALGAKDAPYFLDAVAAIGKKFEAVLTEHDIKGGVWEREGQRTALPVGERCVLRGREGSGPPGACPH
jgi:hypothetical protein